MARPLREISEADRAIMYAIDQIREMKKTLNLPPDVDLNNLVFKARSSNPTTDELLQELRSRVDDLRPLIKYKCLDLEATGRENVYLRKMLEETDGQSKGPRPQS